MHAVNKINDLNKIGFWNLGTQLILLGDSTKRVSKDAIWEIACPFSHIFRGVGDFFRMKLNFLQFTKGNILTVDGSDIRLTSWGW